MPDFLADRDPGHPEAKFLERLKNELPDDFIVIPSLEVARRRDAKESEVDFVLLHPRGRLVIELKGGVLRRVNGRWQRRKGGVWEREERCPFYQSRVNSHAVNDYIEQRFGKHSPEAQALFGRVVIFPDAEVEIDNIESPSQMVLDLSDLAGPGSLLAAMLDLLKLSETHFRQGKQLKDRKLQEDEAKRVAASGGVAPEIVDLPLESIRLPEPLTPQQLLVVADSLRPDLLVVPNLSASDVERALVRLSAVQLRALDKVQASKRLRVVGGPGSGKTLLAVEVARRELRADPSAKVALLCFNRGLGSFLADVARSEGLLTAAAGSFYVHIDRILGDVGRADGDAVYYQSRVRDALAKARALPEAGRFDVLIVDEGQDFRDDPEKLALLDALVKGGLTRGRWRWFEDPDQLLTPTPAGSPPPAADGPAAALDDNAVFELTGNWRNTEQIAQKVCAALGIPHQSTGVALEGPDVTVVPIVEGREFDLLDALVRKVIAPDLAVRRYTPSDVIILGMRGKGKGSFEGRSEVGGHPLVPYEPTAEPVPGAIRATSVFKFKGMESHVVILTDMDSLETLRDRRKAYVGMSRARYKLFLIASQQVIARLSPPKPGA